VSTSVQILIKDERDSTSLAQEIARSLGANGFMAGQDGNVLSLDAQRWIKSEGTGILDLKPVEMVEEGEEGEYGDTAYAPYNHELVLEFRGPHGMARGELRELFGRALFDRLTGLGRPLAYGEVGGDLFADFLPARGVRDFPPGTDYEEPGRSLWFEPRLHGTPEPTPSADRSERLQGRGVVFESDGFAAGSAHLSRRSGRTPIRPASAGWSYGRSGIRARTPGRAVIRLCGLPELRGVRWARSLSRRSRSTSRVMATPSPLFPMSRTRALRPTLCSKGRRARHLPTEEDCREMPPRWEGC
jgi:hypothetical protein